MSAEVLYNKSLRSFLLKKHSLAASGCVKAIALLSKDYNNSEVENLKLNVWMLYLNVVSTIIGNPKSTQAHYAKLLGTNSSQLQPNDVCSFVWRKLKESYSTAENIDIRIMSTLLTMTANLEQFAVAKDITEEWFTCLSDAVLDNISQQIKQEHNYLVCAYIEIVELYVTRILPGLNEFETAEAFIDYNTILTESKLLALKEAVRNYKKSIEQREKEEKDRLLMQQKEIVKEEEVKKVKEEEEVEIKEETQLIRTVQVEKDIIPNYTSVQNSKRDKQMNRLMLIKNWINQIAIKGTASYATILIIAFLLVSLLNGQRRRISIVLQSLFTKFFQTIKMGTTVTYM
ncbi:hypothetical protein G6F46_012308 [Rhizopus delemar]|uniref:Uncharacterized protein n=2 Tax=Rhizopus TaxID=4842 RepID=A0A9P6YRG5_9FUNG|nr:hypothetical protein G6F55_012065 [Rhizopus delemar]KAG1533891.1 hypothetical protein G6F51_012389 [Rhizopus arrhizus]KAG1488325.1 hypothetical protein G6F54_012133 [Rhizopus delemar]KAG1496454.1 hypothetical protein G6F53_012171 [Rhizopus delemar]KAG1507806.1 hypothetical protein G6F52_011545 [Rhizopus delemar]